MKTVKTIGNITFKVEHLANMVFVTDNEGQVWKAWNECEFTERKLNNYFKKLEAN